MNSPAAATKTTHAQVSTRLVRYDDRMQSRHGDLSNVDGGEASVQALHLRNGGYAQRNQLRYGSIVSIPDSERGIPVGSPGVEFLAPRCEMVRYRSFHCGVVQIECGVSLNVPESYVDVRPLKQKLGRRNITVI